MLRFTVLRVMLITLLVPLLCSNVQAQTLDDITILDKKIAEFRARGAYAEAMPLAERARSASERLLGSEHVDTLRRTIILGVLYKELGRLNEADAAYGKALEVGERVLGREHPLTLAAVNNLSVLRQVQGRYAEAVVLSKRVLEANERVFGPESPQTFVSVNVLAVSHQYLGHYGEAELLYKRALEGFGRVLGHEHPQTLISAGNLAALFQLQGHYDEAEVLYGRVLESNERVLGREHPYTLISANNVALLLQLRGKYAASEALTRRTLEIRERTLGRQHPHTLQNTGSLGQLYMTLGRFTEAEILFKRILETSEHSLGRDHPDTLIYVSNLAALYAEQGRYSEAEPFYQRMLETSERVLGREHPQTLAYLNNVSTFYQLLGRYAEAEKLLRRALEVNEHRLGLEHPQTLVAVTTLAACYQKQHRNAEAEPLLKRAIEAQIRVSGADHLHTITGVNNLGYLYRGMGRLTDAEVQFRTALQACERTLGREHPQTLVSLANLATLQEDMRRYAEAEPMFLRVLEASERVLGREHPSTLGAINNLAMFYLRLGRRAEGEPLLLRALEARARVLGADHPDTLTTINNMAITSYARGDWEKAALLWRRSTAAIAARTLRGGPVLTGVKESEADQLRWSFWMLVKAIYHQGAKVGKPQAEAIHETFQLAQWALNSEAAQALTQMAVRSVKGDEELAEFVRERQDLITEWQKRELRRNAVLGREAAKRDPAAEAENMLRLTTIDQRIAEIDKRLAAEFPDYATLASPAPVSVTDVQAQLGEDEALILFLDTPEARPTPQETFVWVVTKTGVRWGHSDLGTAELSREIQALRCGLDADAWKSPRCGQLTGQNYTEATLEAGKPLPFDHARAYKVYKALFEKVEDDIRGKHLLIVPSGALTQLPFQVLVTVPPSINGNHKSAAWLIRDHALSVLPAVSSLKALRRVARRSAAPKPMIGFGNPLLDGPQNHPNPRYAAYFKKRAQLARDNRECRTTFQRSASVFGWRGMTPMRARGGLADVAAIRELAPLPETADELCAVADDLKSDPNELRLGDRATEREVKALSASGQLAQYRIVHFATHGALAGQLEGSGEPGLILTPPAAATEDNDGYLSASEIASLKLDADWVILSACNTAAGDVLHAKPLSGLARAFIYAQARALLVSHWAVDSPATVNLITGAMREMTSDAKVGRAEALRRSMLALIDKGEPKEAHPAIWAPFVVVGEGAR